MSFNIANLVLQAHGNNRKLWNYKSTADTLATIKASGYFGQDSTTGQQAALMLSANDLIHCEGSDGLANLRVDTISGNTVTTESGFGESKVTSTGIQNLQTSGGKFIIAPFDGFIGRVKAVTNGEVNNTTTITVKNAAGAVAVTLTLDQSGQGAGEVYEGTATANNTVTEGDAIQVNWDGATDVALHATEEDIHLDVEFLPG